VLAATCLIFPIPFFLSLTNRYYRKGTLNGNGTISWNAADAAVTGVTGAANPELNALIANGKPVLWRAGQGNGAAGRFTFGNQLDSLVSWVDSADAPPLAPTTGGGFSGGAILPVGGGDPDDLIVLRLTTSTTYALGNHRLVSIKYDADGERDTRTSWCWWTTSTDELTAISDAAMRHLER